MSLNNNAIIYQAIMLIISELKKKDNVEYNVIQDAVETKIEQIRSVLRENIELKLISNPTIMLTAEEREIFLSSPIYLRREKNHGYWVTEHANLRDDFSTQSFRANYRMGLNSFNLLVDTLSQHPVFQLTAHNATPTYIQVGTVLWRFANSHFGCRTAKSMLGVSQGAFHNFSERFEEALIAQLGHIISWPSTTVAFNDIKHDFEYPHGELGEKKLPNVIGAVDGKLINIHRPPKNAERYRDRKGNLSLNMLAVCDWNCYFMYIYAGDSGRSHDARVFRRSQLPLFMQQPEIFFPEGTYLLGDSAFPLSKYLITPYSDSEADPDGSKGKFNKTFSSMRSAIERAFGQLVKRWRFLFNYVYMTSIERDVKVITCCVILHNFCKTRNDGYIPVPDDDVQVGRLFSNLNGSSEPSGLNRDEGVSIRNNLRELVRNNEEEEEDST